MHAAKTSTIVNKCNDLCTLPRGILGPHPGARPGEEVHTQYSGAGPFSMWSSQAQLQKETWVRPHVGPSHTGAIEVWCYMDRVAVKGSSPGGPVAEASYREMELL